MDISIIIVSWNVRGLLEKCLASLYSHTEGITFEVIVVDNASSDGSVEMAQEKFQDMQVIALDENKGFATANNIGIKESSGKYILLLNPDTELTENSLKKVFDKMESNESIGILGCKLLNTDGTLQDSVRKFPRVQDLFALFFKLYKLFPSLLHYYLAKDFDYRREAEVDQVMGAFFCINRSVIDKIGPLDSKYFIWFEEVDFCRRAKRAGFKIVYWPGTSIIHHGGQSFGQVQTAKKQWWFFRSALRYLTK
ncbi:hypothetical protein BK004_03580 [bacterium CG10_46_32]|nr:MAG: hypothetical protein BK004_03580 [bacterium CG10_46_32]